MEILVFSLCRIKYSHIKPPDYCNICITIVISVLRSNKLFSNTASVDAFFYLGKSESNFTQVSDRPRNILLLVSAFFKVTLIVKCRIESCHTLSCHMGGNSGHFELINTDKRTTGQDGSHDTTFTASWQCVTNAE